MERALILSIEKEIKNIKSRHKQKYGMVFFDVQVKNINDVVILEGIVLTERQKNEVGLMAKEIIKNNKIENKIKVLSDPKEKLEIGWGVINVGVADIWAKLQEEKKIIGKSLASQALKNDFVRVLAKKNKWSLTQTCDQAIGWIEKYQISNIKYQISKQKWERIKRADQNKAIRVHLDRGIQNKFLHFLKKYLTAPYLLGGATEKGIDCSWLTQRFYLDIFGITLPRHSGDQAICGEKIELGAACFGDLIYLRRKETKLAHIALVAEKIKKIKTKRRNFNNILILNSRPEKGVAIEYLPEILKSYDLISIKRIIKDF